MQLRNQVEWALHCCGILAGVPDGRYLPTKALAEFHGVPKEYLSKALQALSQAGLVESTLGPSGGYRLARAPEAISFLDIVEAVEGKASTFVCTNIRFNNPCVPKGDCTSAARPCAIARVMWEADKAWRDRLKATTLASLGQTLMTDLDADTRTRIAGWVADHS
ncbi:RrF2 family transcriptional regulator [Pseudokordiimonas caeni]|uniref:RrF2 family transcriptional regulator n=1 Tax=Pseudokordiimonas caeni TaxID=2997908 RepID=UPI002810B2F8|nr:Rrf2 family transcriptional regulator [Pseudokordiimonas caeni]